LSDRGHAIVDERTNSIILTDTEEKIVAFRKVIDQVDIPIRQVMIEARIVIANNDFRKELGARMNFAGETVARRDQALHNYSGKIDDFFDNEGEGGAFRITDNEGKSIGEDSSRTVNLGVEQPFGNIAWSIISGRDLHLALELSALEEAGFSELVSQPKVITGDKQPASIESGTEIPYREASASGAATVAFKEAVLKLQVTPQITPDDNIIMDLKVNQDSVSEITTEGVPAIDVTELNTQVLVGDGETVVLGGIFQTENVKGQSKVPLLGDIPLIGRLFRKDVNRDSKKELIIFITPRIMTNTVTK
jgi:type IV pilus assembly protein PilQ